MAVPEQIPVVSYVADGVVEKFDVPFEYDQQSDLHVYVDGVEPTIDKYFFADNAFNFYIAPTSGQDVKIKRITPKERDTDYDLHTNTVRPKALNTDFDRLWYVLQEVFSDVGGLSQTVQDEIIARIQGDEDLLNQLTAEISARMLGDETITDDLKNYIDNIVALIIGDPSFNGIDADKVNDASGETQQQVNYSGGSKWHSLVGGYKLNERVVLTNGDIVKSTIDGNTNDPNVDMTGWVNTNSTSQIFDESGETQQEINTSIQSNLNKYGYVSTIMNVANNVADISAIPKNNVSGKMIVRIAQYAVGIGTVGSRYYVCTSKGGNNNSYTFFELRRGVTTTTGSIGGDAELLRVTSVYEGAHAWTGRHAKSGESAVGDWLEVVYTPTGYIDANKFSRSITTGVDLWKYYSVQGAGVKFITFNTPFDMNGEASLQFYATSGSASDVKIYIDDVLHKTVSLVAVTAGISRIKLEATAGYHTVKVERPTTGTVNVFGVNYSDVKDAKYGTALDGFVMWHNNVMFTNSEGANDYAIIDATSGLLGGSFHGGETLQSETYVIDGVVGNPLAAITLCKNIEIRQNTKIQWASASLDVASTHRFDEDSGYRLDTTFTGNVTSNTFYTAMHTTPVSYSIISYPQYMDLSSAPDGFKKLDRSNLVVQDDPTTGKRIYSEMTLFNADLGNIYGGPSVRKVSGSYNKMYYGIAVSSPQLINVTTLKSTLTKQFV